MNNPFQKNLNFDQLLLLTVFLLMGIGVVMVYSASSISAERELKLTGYFFLRRQAISLVLAVIVMYLAMHFNHHFLRKLVIPFLIMSIVLLILVLIPGIGADTDGFQRWFRWYGFSFQPSELAKLAMVLYLAHSLVRKQDKIKTFKFGFLPYLLLSGFMIFLIFKEPDMGGAVILGILVYVMLFVAGTRLIYLGAGAVLAAPVGFYMMASAEYRWDRVRAYINPWDNMYDSAWHIIQSFLAFGSGGVWGVGLGEGRQKLFYLPEAHTDFIFSVIGEELGLIGVLAVIILFSIMIYRGFMISLRASSPFGSYLALGLTCMLGIPAFINMAVVTGILPTKGLVLPFVSYGGSSLIFNALAVGILLNISSQMYRTR